MTAPVDLFSDPEKFDFFSTLRRLEQAQTERPRIGDNATEREAIARFGQNPDLRFPTATFAAAVARQGKAPELRVRFLGLLGPQGALPLTSTEEAIHFGLNGDDAFPRFLDLFNDRFIQLFFRAWADARPIAQNDRPESDRFRAYVGAHVGTAPAYAQGRDVLPDELKLGFAGLMAPKAKSASRLRSLLFGAFGIRVEIEEFVAMRLALDPADVTRLGGRHAALGQETMLGGSILSIQDKIRIRLFTPTMAIYETFLPSGPRAAPLHDLVDFYLGPEIDWEIELVIPAREVAPMRLGASGRLGWTGWCAPDWAAEPGAMRADARFHLAERRREQRRAAATT